MNDYDALPYASMPFPETQPSHLAALAALFSHPGPAVDTARVLELGCASGGNIIPLAVRFPNAVFEGVDLSERHVREGTALIKELGLGNITIRQGDITALDLAGQSFDYILCHGVFSWVPKTAQDAILRICGQHLSDNGLAYISYNVLPGWHLRLIVRDICLHHAGAETAPRLRVARARQILEHLAQADDATTYGKVLREEAQRNLRMNDSYILGELLGAHNDPCHFADFVARAGSHGLAYLCDAGIGETQTPPLDAAQGALLPADQDGAAAQYSDFFTGHPFRRSILVKASTPPARSIGPAGLAQLHFACPLIAEAGADGTYVLRRDAANLKTNDPVVGQALTWLAAAYPETRSFQEVLAHAVKASGQPPAACLERLSEALMRTIQKGHVTASTVALVVEPQDAERPALWAVARAQIRLGQTWVSNQLHAPVDMPLPTQAIALLFDGVNTQAQIEQRLVTAIANGEIVVNGGTIGSDPAALGAVAHQLFTLMRRDFRRNALLSPAAQLQTRH